MKHLLGTLYVVTDGMYLSLDNENVLLNMGKETVQRFPLVNIQNIICFSFKGASPALMGECAKRGIGLSFFSPFGKFLARVNGISSGNVLLRKVQYRYSDNVEQSCLVARNFISGKIFNAHSIINRVIRDHAMSVDVDKLKEASKELMRCTRLARNCSELGELRGIEGHAAQVYFSVFEQCILQNKDTFCFKFRNKRPPQDPVNAMLSFLYVILAHDCSAALEGVGLDSYVGFMHRDRPGRTSLGLDLMEELRHVLVDRCVLYLINNRMINEKCFEYAENEACLLNENGRKIVLSEWERRKKESIIHPYLNEKIQYGLIVHVQALLLARYIRGDIEEYPAFLWK